MIILVINTADPVKRGKPAAEPFNKLRASPTGRKINRYFILWKK